MPKRKKNPDSYVEPTTADETGATFADDAFPGALTYDPTTDEPTGLDPSVAYPRPDDVADIIARDQHEPIPDDDQVQGDGVTELPLTWEYESIALHNDLARRMRDLAIDLREWADQEGTTDALRFADALDDLFERFGPPDEDTDT